MNNNIRIPIITILMVIVCAGWAQNVSSVAAEQQGNTIQITYYLDKAADISVYVSTNGGRSYSEMRHTTGDVGKTITPGHKTIIWNVLEDYENFEYGDVLFMVKAYPKNWESKVKFRSMPRNTFLTANVAYSPLPQWSYGFKVGQVKIVGWYLSAMTNFNFRGIYKPIEEGNIYDITKAKTSRISGEVGLVVRPAKAFAFLFGIGYGYRTQTLKTSDGKWYSYPKRTYHGVDLSAGFLFDIKGFALTTEVVTTNFKTIEGNIGVGFSLPATGNHKKTDYYKPAGQYAVKTKTPKDKPSKNKPINNNISQRQSPKTNIKTNISTFMTTNFDLCAYFSPYDFLSLGGSLKFGQIFEVNNKPNKGVGYYIGAGYHSLGLSFEGGFIGRTSKAVSVITGFQVFPIESSGWDLRFYPGVIFHISNFLININELFSFRGGAGFSVGLGFCIPNKNRI